MTKYQKLSNLFNVASVPTFPGQRLRFFRFICIFRLLLWLSVGREVGLKIQNICWLPLEWTYKICPNDHGVRHSERTEQPTIANFHCRVHYESKVSGQVKREENQLTHRTYSAFFRSW